MNKYAIITPAYNEQDNLPRLYHSILNQVTPPACWIIVDDGSTDQTATIINQMSQQHDFIKFLRLPRNLAGSYYAHKVWAFNHGYELLQTFKLDYHFIGNLDADISLDPEYYKDILIEFSKNRKLGVAGGSYCYPNKEIKVIWGGNYVPGSILTARRDCFEQIGGYRPLKHGAEDTLLCIMAELHGWEVAYFPQYQAMQHRIVGTGGGYSALRGRFRQGLSEYNIGYHPLFTFAKFVKRCIQEKPYVIGSLTRYIGYITGSMINYREHVDEEIIKHIRGKQKKRLMFDKLGEKISRILTRR